MSIRIISIIRTAGAICAACILTTAHAHFIAPAVEPELARQSLPLGALSFQIESLTGSPARPDIGAASFDDTPDASYSVVPDALTLSDYLVTYTLSADASHVTVQTAPLAGYVHDVRGRESMVTAFVNHPNADKGRAVLDQLLIWVAEGGASVPGNAAPSSFSPYP